MLTREQRDRWAEELEGGRWKQTRGTISRGPKTFCCLGVLSHAVLGKPRYAIGLVEYPTLELGCEVKRRFEQLNDEDKLSFPEIAKHVRALPVSDGEP